MSTTRAVRVQLKVVLAALAVVVAGSVGAGATGVLLAEEADLATSPQVDGPVPPVDNEALAAFVEPDHVAAVPVGPGKVAEPVKAVLTSSNVINRLGESGIPEVALRAYQGAATRRGIEQPTCGIRWTLLAAIGRVESNHGRFGGAQLREDGSGTKPIRGIPLDGRPNVALIRDSDGGALDGDTTFDRAVGPMQFIPTTWRSSGADGNNDGQRDPNNIIDAAHGAAGYLCGGGGDLRDMAERARAVRRYNNADEYVQVVLRLAESYETGRVDPLPSLPAVPPELAEPEPAEPAPAAPNPAPPTTPTPPPPPAPADSDDTAAVGWGPAIREVVVGIIKETPAPPATTAPPPTTTAPPTTTTPPTVPCPPAPDTPPTSDTTVPTPTEPPAVSADPLSDGTTCPPVDPPVEPEQPEAPEPPAEEQPSPG